MKLYTKRCKACGDAVDAPSIINGAYVQYGYHLKAPTSYCSQCFAEKIEGEIPNVTGPTFNTPMGSGLHIEEPSPWQENAIRDLEGSD